jgi:hypothetical protein
MRALLLALLVAGCAQESDGAASDNAAQTYVEQPTPASARSGLWGEDTCRMAAHAHLLGKAEAEIDRASLPARGRVLCATCTPPPDHYADRLNVQLTPDGVVGSLYCG